MTKPIIVRFHPTAAEAFRPILWNFRKNVHPIIRWVCVLGYPSIMIAAVILNPPTFYIWLPAILGIALIPLAIRQNAKKRFEMKSQNVWTITEGNLKLELESVVMEFKWEAFKEVLETPQGFLFYQAMGYPYWLPRHGFTDENEFGRLSALAKGRSKLYQRL